MKISCPTCKSENLTVDRDPELGICIGCADCGGMFETVPGDDGGAEPEPESPQVAETVEQAKEFLKAQEVEKETPQYRCPYEHSKRIAWDENATESVCEVCGEDGVIWERHHWKPAPTETRVVDPSTGGEKGSKLERYDLIPADFLDALAHHFGVGANKYEDRNWERGYRWGLSFAALMRHAWAFWRGEDVDKETGTHHMVSAAWHCAALFCFSTRNIGTDDRAKGKK